MKVVVAGSRTIEYTQVVSEAIENSPFDIDEIIHGGAKGVDARAGLWSTFNNVAETKVKPDYSKYKSNVAPLKRNNKMLEMGDALIAIWDGESNGTEYTIHKAKSQEGWECIEEYEPIEHRDIIVKYYA